MKHERRKRIFVHILISEKTDLNKLSLLTTFKEFIYAKPQNSFLHVFCKMLAESWGEWKYFQVVKILSKDCHFQAETVKESCDIYICDSLVNNQIVR